VKLGWSRNITDKIKDAAVGAEVNLELAALMIVGMGDIQVPHVLLYSMSIPFQLHDTMSTQLTNSVDLVWPLLRVSLDLA
jgi:hypothetical protein